MSNAFISTVAAVVVGILAYNMVVAPMLTPRA